MCFCCCGSPFQKKLVSDTRLLICSTSHLCSKKKLNSSSKAAPAFWLHSCWPSAWCILIYVLHYQIVCRKKKKKVCTFHSHSTRICTQSLLASSFVVFVVLERMTNAKHIQFISGVDFISYWVSVLQTMKNKVSKNPHPIHDLCYFLRHRRSCLTTWIILCQLCWSASHSPSPSEFYFPITTAVLLLE